MERLSGALLICQWAGKKERSNYCPNSILSATQEWMHIHWLHIGTDLLPEYDFDFTEINTVHRFSKQNRINSRNFLKYFYFISQLFQLRVLCKLYGIVTIVTVTWPFPLMLKQFFTVRKSIWPAIISKSLKSKTGQKKSEIDFLGIISAPWNHYSDNLTPELDST